MCMQNNRNNFVRLSYTCIITGVGIMHRLLVFLFLIYPANAGLVRLPKIYNALISSDENLTPSHAYPILEPVFRTTALGVAFPPLIVHPPSEKEGSPLTEDKEDKKAEASAGEKTGNKGDDEKPKKDEKLAPEISYHGSLYPLAYDPYFPYAYSNEFLFPALPFYQQPVYVDLSHFGESKKEKEKEEVAKPKPAVNFKKNPDIPDVPPPPLPIKINNSKDKA